MKARALSLVAAVCVGLVAAHHAGHPTLAGVGIAKAGEDGVVRVRSRYALAETVERLKADIAAKGITFFQAIDQSQLAVSAGIALRPSTLLVFGNPALGSHFITARPEAGLDWPVRLLVSQDDTGQVWAFYSDFDWVARRHNITSRKAEFDMASKVIGSITASVAAE